MHGWILASALDVAALDDLRSWVDDIASWPDEGAGWLHHRELTDDGPKLCRSENLIPFHEGLRALLTTGTMVQAAGALLGGPAILYKEKINYKLPGGAGYAPHQDAPAYPFVNQHVSCMLAIDDSTVDNGCLEVADGMHSVGLPLDEAGCIAAEVASTLRWMPVEMTAGRPCGSTPAHRTAVDRTSRPRHGERSTPRTTPRLRVISARTTTARSERSSPAAPARDGCRYRS